jgi:putative hydrolase of HD superfamily
MSERRIALYWYGVVSSGSAISHNPVMTTQSKPKLNLIRVMIPLGSIVGRDVCSYSGVSSKPPGQLQGHAVWSDRLERQLRFLRELDKLKGISRRISLIDRSRLENSAEHSWHLGTMAVALAEYAPPGADIPRVVEMLLVHDVVEIDAGDTFAFDAAANVDKEEREKAAANRLFGLLPDDDGRRLRALWDEFEENETPAAKFANALDRLQGLLMNDAAGDGGTWRIHSVKRSQVLARMAPIEAGAPALWPVVIDAVDRAVARGDVRDDLA